MKYTALLSISILALVGGPTSVLAEAFPKPHIRPPMLMERKPCYHASDCSWFYAAKCEQYCRQQGGQHSEVDRMEKCNLLNQKRCCCTK